MSGLFGSLASGLRRREVKASDMSGLTWSALLGQQNSHAGVSVNIDSALKVSTVFACLRVLADGVAQVPLKVYREMADGTKVLAKDHSAYRLLSRRPNEWMTSFEFRQVMMFHAALLGNGCAYIGRIRGLPRELIPLVPGRLTIEQASDYTLTYRLADLDGRSTVLSREDVFHLRGPSWTGAAGLDALQVAREAVGLAIATEQTHAALHANGTQPGGVLSVKGSLDDAARARLKEAWAQYQGGLQNRFKTAVLDMDSTWTPLAMKGVDAEHLDTRRFQIEEICRDLKVFPQMVGYADKTATFASAEAFFLAHVIHTLAPWIENWEQSLARDLFPDEDDIVAKFSMQGLLRGDNAARASFYASGITNGWLTRNEARRLEDLNPIEGLGEPLLPLNMGTQAEREATARDVTAAVKSLIGHNGGPGPDDQELERKIGRVLSATNERRIVGARDNLDAVLATLGES